MYLKKEKKSVLFIIQGKTGTEKYLYCYIRNTCFKIFILTLLVWRVTLVTQIYLMCEGEMQL